MDAPALVYAAILALICAVAAAALMRMRSSSDVCGFTLPGSSPLWATQSASLSLVQGDDADGWPTVNWPTGVPLDNACVGRDCPKLELSMSFMQPALAALDAGKTTIPALPVEAAAMIHRLRAQMVPHVVRSATVAATAWESDSALGALRGTAKPNKNGALVSYLRASAERPQTLDEYRRSDGAGLDMYWVLCRAYDAATGGADSRHEAADDAVEALAARLSPLVLLGFMRSRIDSTCLRVTRSSARVPLHADNFHNLLVQLSGGSRRVLLFMPDTMSLLCPSRHLCMVDGNGGTGMRREGRMPLSSVDPRDVNDENETASRAPALVATLHPGDALFIPVGWWHYVESYGSADEPAVAANFAIGAENRSEMRWVEVPCER